MPDTTNQIKVCGSQVVNTTVFPDTKLQTLDRRVGKDQLYFDKDLFAVTLEDWTGIPIIYHPDGVHPTDFNAVNRDPVTAAEDIGGKLVGSVSNPRIVVPGGARLMAELDIDEDEQELTELWKQGKLFPSTGFMANSDGDRLITPPIPNHVLLFPIKVDEVLPGDYGAFVNTLEVQTTMTCEKNKKKTCNAETAPVDAQVPEKKEPVQEPAPETEALVEEATKAVDEVAEDVAEKQTELDELKSELELLKQEIASIKASAEQPAAEQEPVTNTEEPVAEEAAADVIVGLDEEIKWRDEAIAELKAEIEALKAGKAALEEKISGMETAAAEAEFNTVLERLPVGMKATPEQVEALHTQFIEGNTKAMLFTLLNTPAQTGATQRVGQPYAHSNTNKPANAETVGDLCKSKIKKE